MLISCPCPLLFLEGVEDLLGGRELGQMQVFDAADFAQEKSEVILLGKTGQLRPVVEAGIDQRANA